METKINNSVVANNNSTISNSTIKSTDEEIKQDYNIKNSVVAQNGSQITNASIDITKEKILLERFFYWWNNCIFDSKCNLVFYSKIN